MWTTQRTMYAKWYGMTVETIKRRTPVVTTRCLVELTANAVGERLDQRQHVPKQPKHLSNLTFPHRIAKQASRKSKPRR